MLTLTLPASLSGTLSSNSAVIGYAAEEAVRISAHLSIDIASESVTLSAPLENFAKCLVTKTKESSKDAKHQTHPTQVKKKKKKNDFGFICGDVKEVPEIT